MVEKLMLKIPEMRPPAGAVAQLLPLVVNELKIIKQGLNNYARKKATC
jgi:hypothetical protein